MISHSEVDFPDVVKIQLVSRRHARRAFDAGFDSTAMLAVALRTPSTVANLQHPHYWNAGNLTVGESSGRVVAISGQWLRIPKDHMRRTARV